MELMATTKRSRRTTIVLRLWRGFLVRHVQDNHDAMSTSVVTADDRLQLHRLSTEPFQTSQLKYLPAARALVAKKAERKTLRETQDTDKDEREPCTATLQKLHLQNDGLDQITYAREEVEVANPKFSSRYDKQVTVP